MKLKLSTIPRHYDKDYIQRLAANIKKIGQLSPIQCLPDGTIIDGQARFKACKKLGIEPLYYITPWLAPSEAIYGFMAWLTTRKVSICIGAHHHCGVVVDLIEEWSKVNALKEPRNDWTKHLVHPKRGNNVETSKNKRNKQRISKRAKK